MSEKKWYAIYTRARCEKKVADLLSKKNIENYCPLNKVQRQWADRKKIIHEPLFTSYVFVRLSQAEHLQMIKTDGVVSFVYWLGKPAIIKDLEIDMIRRFLDEYTNVKLEKTSVNINDMVRIISGPLMEHAGQVIAVKSKSVKIILPSLGYMMSAEVELDKVELISDKLRFFVGNQGKLILG
ncbi:UpxY family transcription antiterminator [Flavitalea sp.]|nr:UpxY family transcription antiterminator [Flavitalea sp.]